MRIPAATAIVCAMLAVLAPAAALATSSKQLTPESVRVLLPRAVLRAGESVMATVVNTHTR